MVRKQKREHLPLEVEVVEELEVTRNKIKQLLKNDSLDADVTILLEDCDTFLDILTTINNIERRREVIRNGVGLT